MQLGLLQSAFAFSSCVKVARAGDLAVRALCLTHAALFYIRVRFPRRSMLYVLIHFAFAFR